MQIIGLSGKAGSGKDFVGKEILRPAGYKQFNFAWHMKNEAVGHGFTYDDVHFNKPPAVREFLQKRGTEEGWMKHGRQYWCQITGAWLRTLRFEHGVERFYIPDVRFPHEAEFVRSLGGTLVRLELGDRPPRLEHTCSADSDHQHCPACHSSETALDSWKDWDAVIVNGLSTTKEDIAQQLITVGVRVPYRLAFSQSARISSVGAGVWY